MLASRAPQGVPCCRTVSYTHLDVYKRQRFEGVESSFAIQAGREVRIMVKPDAVNDDQLVLLAHAISHKIEEELDYPGQIKVNVIRESLSLIHI